MDTAKQKIGDSFICIPEWETKDAEMLLNMLDVTQWSRNEPVSNNRFLVPLSRIQTKNQYVSNMVMDTVESDSQIDLSADSQKVDFLDAENQVTNGSSSEIERSEQSCSDFGIGYMYRPCV